jgi:hypothetical protein
MPKETLTTLRTRISELEGDVKNLEAKNVLQMHFIAEMNQHYLSLVNNTLVIVRSASAVKASIAKFLEDSGMDTPTSPKLPVVPIVPVVPPPPPAVKKS